MSLDREVETTQNPALGAVLLWKFSRGYSPPEGDLRSTPLPLLFLVLPVCLRADLRDLVLSTRKDSGLRKLEEKLHKIGADRVWTLSNRVKTYRTLTTRSMGVGIATRLLRLDIAQGGIMRAREEITDQIDEAVRPLLTVAERFGAWCGELDIHEVMSILRVPL